MRESEYRGSLECVLRVLVVDDELPALEELTYLLRLDSRIGHVSAAPNPAEALRDLGRCHLSDDVFDAVFLDIRMPGLDGIDFARLLAGFSRPPRVVFVTAHEDYAVQAFDLQAVDYLLKPVRSERLAVTIGRLEAARVDGTGPGGTGAGGTGAGGAGAGGAGQDAGGDEKIPVELGGRTKFVCRSQICFAEAQGDYVRLHTTDGGGYLVRTSLVTLARRWETAGFVRIHRSILVAGDQVTELRMEDGRTVVEVGDRVLPVSRRHARAVRDRLVRPFYRADMPPTGRTAEPVGAAGRDGIRT